MEEAEENQDLVCPQEWAHLYRSSCSHLRHFGLARYQGSWEEEGVVALAVAPPLVGEEERRPDLAVQEVVVLLVVREVQEVPVPVESPQEPHPALLRALSPL